MQKSGNATAEESIIQRQVNERQIDKWTTPDHIALWLASIGLPQYATSFRQNGVSDGLLLLQVDYHDLPDLRVLDGSHQTLLLKEIDVLRTGKDHKKVHWYREPLWKLQELHLISAQELQMMFGILERTISIPSHKLSALESGLEFFNNGSISARTAAEICKDVRRQAVRLLGLTDEDLLHPSYAPDALEADMARLADELRVLLDGKPNRAAGLFECIDTEGAGMLTIDDFVSTLADVLPPHTDRRRLRRMARRLDADADGRVDYRAFLDAHAPAVNARRRTAHSDDHDSDDSRSDSRRRGKPAGGSSSEEGGEVFVQRFAGRNHIVRPAARAAGGSVPRAQRWETTGNDYYPGSGRPGSGAGGGKRTGLKGWR